MTLPAPQGSAVNASNENFHFLKVSISDPIVIIQDQVKDTSGHDAGAQTISQPEAGPLYADTSDVNDLLDNSGVGAFPHITSTLTWEPAAFPEFAGEFHKDSGHSDIEEDQYQAKISNSERQLKVKGRSIIRRTARRSFYHRFQRVPNTCHPS